MKEEIIQLRNEITRLSSELRHNQLLQRNNANVLSEITSLKAIVVGRYFILFCIFLHQFDVTVCLAINPE